MLSGKYGEVHKVIFSYASLHWVSTFTGNSTYTPVLLLSNTNFWWKDTGIQKKFVSKEDTSWKQTKNRFPDYPKQL